MRVASVCFVAAFTTVVAVCNTPSTVLAQTVGPGPVSRVCNGDIAKYCAGLRHGRAEVRACLEDNWQRVSAGCRRTLETTGAGWRWRTPR